MEYRIFTYDTLESTNDKAKEIAAYSEEGTVILAREQTKGKGRLGRVWSSTKDKDILMSIILKPEIQIKDIPKITLVGATAINMALRDIGIDSQIKWPNDIVIENKKVSGILTEMSSNSRDINYVIMGIGINVNQDIQDVPEELQYKSTSLKIVKNSVIDKRELLNNILERFRTLYMPFRSNGDMEKVINIYRENSIVIGKEILVIKGKDKIRKGVAIDINHRGELLVEFPEGLEEICSGEVSIRGIEEYGKVLSL
ncbi:biotin--[acetyl-CoA-carboxylase] ligase [Tissierellaceae bacterium HCP3S3_D8]